MYEQTVLGANVGILLFLATIRNSNNNSPGLSRTGSIICVYMPWFSIKYCDKQPTRKVKFP